MNLFFFIVFGLYFLLLLGLIAGWPKPPSSRSKKGGFTKITVVVSFRNEEISIVRLIEDLSNLNYPVELVDVILVNDHSTDKSVEKVIDAVSKKPNFRMLSLPAGKEGKKQGITYAVERAIGDIIVTTDADCRVPADWLSFVSDCFIDGKLKMVLGGVRIVEDQSLFSQLQALEFSSLIGVCGATAGLGFPAMCNGANLAFLKSAFLVVKGYEGNFAIASGDDEFLLRKIDRHFPEAVYFLAEPGAVVSTGPQKTGNDFIHQRLRWAGKWKFSSSPIVKVLSVFVLLFQISFLLLLMMALLQSVDPVMALLLIVTKLILEFYFLFRVCQFLRVRWRTLHFLILQFVYPIYVIFIGLASNFLSYEWKERNRRTTSD